jgi:hypothetical protein
MEGHSNRRIEETRRNQRQEKKGIRCHKGEKSGEGQGTTRKPGEARADGGHMHFKYESQDRLSMGCLSPQVPLDELQLGADPAKLNPPNPVVVIRPTGAVFPTREAFAHSL